jgi:hypothetical protein
MNRSIALALLAPVFVHTPMSGQTRCVSTAYRTVRVVYHPDGSYTRTEEIRTVTTCSQI